MSKRPRSVPLQSRHAKTATFMALWMAGLWLLMNGLGDGWRTSTVVVAGIYFVVTLLAFTWGNWNGENRDTFDLRRMRRVHAVRAKQRRGV